MNKIIENKDPHTIKNLEIKNIEDYSIIAMRDGENRVYLMTANQPNHPDDGKGNLYFAQGPYVRGRGVTRNDLIQLALDDKCEVFAFNSVSELTDWLVCPRV